MPKHNPQRDQGLWQQPFPASLCHVSTHGFASSLPGRDWMPWNLYPLPNLAEIRPAGSKAIWGSSHTRVCVYTHTQSAMAKHLLPVESRQRSEQLHPVILTLALLSVLFPAWLHLMVKGKCARQVGDQVLGQSSSHPRERG